MPKPESLLPTPDELVLGVDGGGTKTTAWLSRRDANADLEPPLGVGLSGPGNPRAVGFETAQSNIAAAVAAAFDHAGVTPCSVATACFGLAGAGRTGEQQRIRRWAIASGIARTVTVTHDAAIALAAGSRSGIGVALLSGTGSLAWGTNEFGRTARSGGWGCLLGDEGSGYAIAVAGLRAAAHAADGRGPRTMLLDLFQQRLDARDPSQLLERIHEPVMTNRQIADLSGVVFDASVTDAVAQEIVQSAATDLARMVEALVSQLELKPRAFELVCAGGVIVHQPSLRTNVLRRLEGQGLAPTVCHVVADPARGAVALAIRQRTARAGFV